MLMLLNRSQTKGFTIVELLIVIVVIAILATITIVAFNGIQDRAKNARLVAAVDAYEKMIRMYKIDHGGIVPALSGSAVLPYVCLGDGYEATSVFSENTCYKYITMSNGADDYVAVNNALRAYSETLPSVGDIEVHVSVGAYSVDTRGIFYYKLNDTTAQLAYFSNGDGDCARGVKTGFASDGSYADEDERVAYTMCEVTIG